MTLESKFIVEKRVKVPFSAMEWISDLFPTTQSKNKFWKENQSHIIQGGIRLTDVSGGDWYLYRSSNRNQKFLLNWRSSWGSGGRGEYIKIDRPITNFINWTQHPFDEVKE